MGPTPNWITLIFRLMSFLLHGRGEGFLFRHIVPDAVERGKMNAWGKRTQQASATGETL
jgi:hypothetical protein